MRARTVRAWVCRSPLSPPTMSYLPPGGPTEPIWTKASTVVPRAVHQHIAANSTSPGAPDCIGRR
jgi:hypothetical protein